MDEPDHKDLLLELKSLTTRMDRIAEQVVELKGALTQSTKQQWDAWKIALGVLIVMATGTGGGAILKKILGM